MSRVTAEHRFIDRISRAKYILLLRIVYKYSALVLLSFPNEIILYAIRYFWIIVMGNNISAIGFILSQRIYACVYIYKMLYIIIHTVYGVIYLFILTAFDIFTARFPIETRVGY